MPHVEPLARDSLPQYEPVFQVVEKNMGFLPRSVLTMSRVPPLAEGFMAMGAAALENKVLTPELTNLITQVVSNADGCRYCQAHTGATLANNGVPDEKIEAVWEFETSDLFTDAERAALRLAFAAGTHPNSANTSHFEECREYYSEEEIVMIVGVCSFMGYLNRWNDTMATELEDTPLAYGEQHLASHGWEGERHRR